MIFSNHLQCMKFTCKDIDPDKFIVPYIEIIPEKISVVMISECSPKNLSDYFYSDKESF